ncbi:MAG TPA: RagB/SusD family nutrient uptake outer membrane protein, partial [Chitinophaga sp.]|uniref:RagB/SusD family nutrient uptake outer membrane protein n=1 Tax=Chitinophaga sp. TaxID=1869181 RepID=UPI002DBB17AC
MKKIIAGICIISTILSASCKKDYTSPSNPPENDVYASTQAVTAVAVGLQRIYSTNRAGGVYNVVTANGFSTNELLLRNEGNIAENQLNIGGGTVDGTNTILGNIWSNSNKIIYEANRVIAYAQAMDDKAYASGLIGYVTIFKALAMGNLSMYWQKAPDSTGSLTSGTDFIDRVAGFNKAIGWIDAALAMVTANPPSSSFLNNIPAGIDITNTLKALKARYALFAGNYNLALTTAQDVTLKPAIFKYDAVFPNPIWETSTSTNNVWQVIDSTLGLPVGLQPNMADKRVPFYTSLNTSIAPRYRINGFGATNITPYPIYIAGEIMLIKAESYARLDQPDLALIELNKVITKKPSEDSLGVGADLPAITGPLTKDQLLTTIYQNRCIELYMSGLKLEDMRRFNRPLTERRRNFFPYPFAERDNNPNTPPDPDF